MTTLWTSLQSTPVELLVLTLLNSLWQGVVWLLLLMLVLRTVPARRVDLRYGLAVGSLSGIVVTMLVTWSLLSGAWHDAALTTGETLATSVAQPGIDATVSSSEQVRTVTGELTAVATTLMSNTPRTETAGSGSARDWIAISAVIWVCGCLLMLVRGLRSIAAARGLLRGRTCARQELLELLDATQACLGLRRPIRLVITDVLTTPAVWGVWKPVLLLPASLSSSLSIAELEAVFAHELAHVRRYDHVVNLLQLLMESILFFNPAVWWISRQVRLEREACCDAAAAGLTGNPVGYATLLALHAAPPSVGRAVPATVLAMTGASSGTLLERVRRLLSPAHRPGMRLSWRTCLLLIAVSGCVLYGLHRGTTVAVQVAAEIMSDDERVETIAEQARQVDPGMIEEPEFDEVRIRGRVLIVPSLTSVDEVTVHAMVRNSHGTRFSTIGAASDEFDVTVEAGMIWLFFHHKETAVSILGPFGPRDGADITEQFVVVTEGEEVSLQVVDDRNEPAAGVNVTASAVVRGNGIGLDRGVTNEAGIVRLRHISPDNEYSISLSGPGYQSTDPPDGPLNPEEEITLTITRAVPARGIIVDEQGQPIAGVQIREYLRQRPSHSDSAGGFEDPIATTNSNGEFVLDTLEDGWRYHFLLEHPRFADVILADIQPGDDNIRGTMVRGVTVTGKVKGADEMPPEARRLSWGEVARLPIGENNGEMLSRTIWHRERVDFGDDGAFTLERVAPGPLQIELGSQSRTFEIGPVSTAVSIDYEPPAPPQTRVLVIRFEHHGRPAEPEGRLSLNGVPDQIGSTMTTNTEVRLVNGRVRVNVPVPMTRPSLHAEPDGLIGFWFNSHDVEWPVIESGEEPYELVIPVHPAGAIEGQVITSDGFPAVDIGVGVTVRFQYPQSASVGRRNYGGGMNVKTDAEGRFFLTPLPLGASCVMAIADGFYRQVGGEITLDGSAPIREVSMSLGPRSAVVGQVLDPNGNPLRAISLELSFNHPRGSMGWSPGHTTDAEGRFQFAGLNADADGIYEADLQFRRDYIPQRVPLRIGSENVIRLEAGRVITGRTLDESGNPVPGVGVYAMRADLDLSHGAVNSYEAEAVTDAEGRFQFSNLPNVRLNINARQLQNEQVVTIEPGETGEILLQGEVAAWYRERLENSGQ